MDIHGVRDKSGLGKATVQEARQEAVSSPPAPSEAACAIELCSVMSQLSCSRCKDVCYCSKEHMESDLQSHKKVCRSAVGDQISKASSNQSMKASLPSLRNLRKHSTGDSKPSLRYYESSSSSSMSSTSSSSSFSSLSVSRDLQSLGLMSSGSLSSLSDVNDSQFEQENEQSTSTGSFRRTTSCGRGLKPLSELGEMQDIDEFNTEGYRSTVPSVSFILGPPQNTGSSDSNVITSPTPFSVGVAPQLKFPTNADNGDQINAPVNVNLSPLVRYIVKNMMDKGICVVDKFLNESLGDEILKEVKALHQDGNLTDGQLVYSQEHTSSKEIRGDKIAWKDGTEEGCSSIGHLISKMDAIIMQCQGHLGKLVINGRTKVSTADLNFPNLSIVGTIE
ncbi:uncharacterized protein DDB_G0271670-like [Lytechinus pictus]|uniref:uncharacterized protein DDB_G0271670-like n=1 Tax=Lytechinus pictus TaxID=7653 RepID=UPI00240D6FC3|nr:uncharacterized protein DDB_G0271670-like [Lytechinus pictus]